MGEGWTFPPEDLERLLKIGVGVAADEGGRLLGVLFLSIYGPLAWIGNVVVATAARGRGVGARLVADALAAAREAGVETVRLHSVHRAESLYERAGFVREGVVHALRAQAPVPARGPPPRLLPLDDAAQVAVFDAERFGADRSRLLALLLAEKANRGWLLRDERGGARGYAILKVSEVACEIGPAVAAHGDAAAARALLAGALAATPSGPLELAIPAVNRDALFAARELGFADAFTARTMRWGRDAHAGDPAAIVAAGGLEKG